MQTFTESSGFFSASNLSPNTTCYYTIKAEMNSVINLYFTNINLPLTPQCQGWNIQVNKTGEPSDIQGESHPENSSNFLGIQQTALVIKFRLNNLMLIFS